MRKLLLLVMLALMAGCASVNPVPISPTIIESDFPKINEQQKIEVGDSLCDQGKSYVYDGQVITSVSPDFMHVFPVGSMFLLKHVGFYSYYPNGPDGIQKGGPIKTETVHGMLAKIGATYDYRQVSVPSYGGLRQQVLYNGRSKDEVFFSYREFVNDLSRPSFTQDLTFNISDDPIIGIKGARFKIIEATNSQLIYIMIKKFN